MEAVLLETKAGKGFKICMEGTWFYTSKNEFFHAISNHHGCTFRTIETIENE